MTQVVYRFCRFRRTGCTRNVISRGQCYPKAEPIVALESLLEVLRDIKNPYVSLHFSLLIIKRRNVCLHKPLPNVKERFEDLHFSLLISKVRNVNIHKPLQRFETGNVSLHFFFLLLKVGNEEIHKNINERN